MLNKVLTVAKPGYMGRKITKNLEPLVLDNRRYVAKQRGITQMLFGGDGFQVQLLGKYSVPFFSASTDQFIEKMCASIPAEYNQFKEKAVQYATQIAEHVYHHKRMMNSH